MITPSFSGIALPGQLIQRAFVGRRIATNQLAIIIEDFAQTLLARGFAPPSIRRHLRVVEHFGRWFQQLDVGLTQLSLQHVQRFLWEHLPQCDCPKPAPTNLGHCRGAMRRLTEFLCDQKRIGFGTAEPKPLQQEPMGHLLSAYDQHLQQVRGLSEGTRQNRQRSARRFLRWRLNQGPFQPRELRPQEVERYVLSQARQLRPSGIHPLCVNLRSFLRFLEFSQPVRWGLSQAIPHPLVPAPQAPPPVLEQPKLRQLLRSFPRSTPTGRRDYAITLCLSELALRSHEVASLTLDDLDWRALTLHLAQTKQRRERLLPLPDKVARAIFHYLKQGRPPTPSRALFVHHGAPIGRALSAPYVRKLVQRSFVRCGIKARGIHLLRHTWATWAHRRGASLKLIADVLGHRSLETTTRYAHVHVEELRQVALPWPGNPR